MCSCKQLLAKIEKFDSVWLYVTAHLSWKQSKAGLWGIRANNLKRIDEENKAVHDEIQKIKKECFAKQESIFLTWLTFATIMLTVF